MKFQEKASSSEKHFHISLIKSCFRIFAFIVLGYGNFVGAAIILGMAEVIGILEEIA